MQKTTVTEVYNGDGTLRERIVVTETEVGLQQPGMVPMHLPLYPVIYGYGPPTVGVVSTLTSY